MSAAPRTSDTLRRGVAWSSVASIGAHLLNLARVVVVARILTPEDFGLFGMAMVVLLGMTAFAHLGLKDAFIAHEQTDAAERERWLYTLWSANLVARLVLAGVIALLAWPAARGYDEPGLFAMLLVLAWVPVVTGLNNPALMRHEKQGEFRPIALLELSIALAGFPVTLALAWWLQSAWALVLGQLAAPAVGVVVSYGFEPMRPRLAWEPLALRQALHFGKYVLLSSILAAIITQLDNLAIGASLGAAALGLYMIAYRISEIPKLVIASALARVLFPYYAQHARSPGAALSRAWLDSAGHILWLVLAAYLPIAFCAQYFVVILFGPQWQAAGPLLSILALLGALRSMNSALNPLLMTLRQTRVEALIKIVEAGVFVPGVFIGLWLAQAPSGVVWAGVAAVGLGLGLRAGYIVHALELSAGALAGRLWRPLAGAVVMSAVGTAGRGHWPPLLLAVVLTVTWALMIGLLEAGVRDWLKHTLGRRARTAWGEDVK